MYNDRYVPFAVIFHRFQSNILKKQQMVLEEGVLPNRMGAGPHGLGDPNDRHLRKVEMEVLVPKIMRDRAKAINCLEEVKAFEKCCKANSVMMVVNCRVENSALKTCLERWYKNDHFVKECTDIYLKERSDYRTSGLTKKQRERIAFESNQ